MQLFLTPIMNMIKNKITKPVKEVFISFEKRKFEL